MISDYIDWTKFPLRLIAWSTKELNDFIQLYNITANEIHMSALAKSNFN